MKATRRGFLGIMGGAAAAGPKLASSLAAEAANNMPSPSFGGYTSGLSPAGPMSEAEYKLSRIAQLRKWIAGDDPESRLHRRERLIHSLELRERYRLDGLRSVSPSYRHAMFVEGNFTRHERINRERWEFELSELTGGLL